MKYSFEKQKPVLHEKHSCYCKIGGKDTALMTRQFPRRLATSASSKGNQGEVREAKEATQGIFTEARERTSDSRRQKTGQGKGGDTRKATICRERETEIPRERREI